MKKLTLLIILVSNLFYAQSTAEKEEDLIAEVPLQIWDSENSEKAFEIDTLIYDEIPKYLDFRGTLLTSLTWTDSKGENLLILTKSGAFDWKDYSETDKTEYDLQDKSELYAYLFLKPKGTDTYKKQWRIYDYIDCFGVDMYVGFKPEATTITDIDKDGIAEVTIPYALYCRGGMDPGIMKIIMYEGNSKFALRGETAICRNGETLYGGEFKADKTTQNNEVFLNFLIQRWETHKCE